MRERTVSERAKCFFRSRAVNVGGLSNASCSAAARMRPRGIVDRMFRDRGGRRSVYIQCDTV